MVGVNNYCSLRQYIGVCESFIVNMPTGTLCEQAMCTFLDIAGINVIYCSMFDLIV